MVNRSDIDDDGAWQAAISLRSSELAKQLPCAFGVSAARVSLGGEVSDVDLPPAKFDLGAIAAIRMKEDSLHARSTILPHALIRQVLRLGADPQVRAPIVESIHVCMIDLSPVRGISEQSMHAHGAVFAIPLTISNRVDVAVAADFRGLPIVARNQRNVDRVNNAFEAGRERNVSEHPFVSDDFAEACHAQ